MDDPLDRRLEDRDIRDFSGGREGIHTDVVDAPPHQRRLVRSITFDLSYPLLPIRAKPTPPGVPRIRRFARHARAAGKQPIRLA